MCLILIGRQNLTKPIKNRDFELQSRQENLDELRRTVEEFDRTSEDRSLAAYLSNVSLEDEQKDRDELLQAEESTIRSLAVYIRAFMGQQAVCAVGNEEKISGSAEIFAVTEHLFQ